ncbi:DUF2070 family protein [Acidianus brierleyi]|uniref:DUF2070 family protein n=1 Tax=Acidianus brierleyi TaxID=41673 RepID=UPI0013A5AF53|nr:DUF2070 family protein [Acidianus brierleyi]
MDSEKITRKYYSKIISLPSLRLLIGVDGIESALILFRGLEIGLAFIYSFISYGIILFVIFRSKIKTGLTIFSFSSIIYLIFSLFPEFYLYSYGIFLPFLDYSLLIDYKALYSSLISFGASIIPVIISVPNDIRVFLYIFLVALITYLYIYSIDRKGTKLLGISSLTVVRPFLRAINYKREDELEKFLDKLSIPYYVNIYTLKISDRLLILPQIHYGLYGSVGSSKLPYIIEEKMKNVVVFHGPGSHDIDLPSRSYSNIIASYIKAETDKGMEPNSFYGIEFNDRGSFKLTTLVFDKSSLTFVERPGKGIDDMPTSLWKDMVENNNFLIDCHNENLKEEFSREEISTIREFIREKKTGFKKPLYFGYAEGTLSEKCEGICCNKVKVMAIGDGEKKILIIYVFGNNASVELGEQLKDKLKDLADRVILVTPDDHTCTGTSLYSLYVPSQPCVNLINISRELGIKAIENMKEVKSEQKIMKIRTKVIGKIISSMVEGLEKVGSYTLRTFWIPIISPYLLLLIFILFYSLIKI